LAHVDFGFIFDIVPGGNIATFEVSPFKLSSEMLDLLGGKIDSVPFKEFMKYVTQGYLAVREYTESIITIVALMMDTELNCFNAESLTSLRNRLCGGKSEKEAVKHITYVASQALSFLSSSTTYVYDVFQNMYVIHDTVVLHYAM
jgi:phosphatidylinositol 4-kinase A